MKEKQKAFKSIKNFYVICYLSEIDQYIKAADKLRKRSRVTRQFQNPTCNK